MNHIAPRRIVSRRASQMLTLAFLLAAAGLFILALGVFLFAVPLDKPAHPSFALYSLVRGALLGLGVLGLAAAAVLAVRALTYRRDNDLALLTGRALEPLLDNRFTFIRSLNRRDTGYIDALLVGPPGLMVFRIVDLTGVYANDGLNWMRRDPGGQWRPARFSPTRQDLADIRKLQLVLRRRGFADVPIFGMIVFTADPSRVALQSKSPALPITHLTALHHSLQQGYLGAPPVDGDMLSAIVRLLLS